ncbi:MAG TPA: cytochrome c oxidase subunit 3 [Tepidisphaeraceae bacterium]
MHPYTATIGMWLFLAALTMLFGATMIGYLVIRSRGNSPALHSMQFPPLLWLSTVVILAGSYTIHMAVSAIRLERQGLMRRYLLITCILAAIFCIVQTPALASLLLEHRRASEGGLRLYGLVFVLILVHALHVLGGIVGLAATAVRAKQGKYDHEHYTGIKNAAMYWHFLDVVWLVMFLSIFFAG